MHAYKNDLETLHSGCGYLEIILGPMFSGKTSRIIDLYKKYTYCDIPVIVVNHADDTRYDNTLLTSHDNNKIECVNCHTIGEIMDNIVLSTKKSNVILINEGQFFDDLYESVLKLVNEFHCIVYVCGLDGDFRANKFGQMLDLIPHTDCVYKLQSICVDCKNGNKGIYSHRKTNESSQKLIGVDTYEPLCRRCYLNKIKEGKKLLSSQEQELLPWEKNNNTSGTTQHQNNLSLIHPDNLTNNSLTYLSNPFAPRQKLMHPDKSIDDTCTISSLQNFVYYLGEIQKDLARTILTVLIILAACGYNQALS